VNDRAQGNLGRPINAPAIHNGPMTERMTADEIFAGFVSRPSWLLGS
jgi:hypothetical protein